MHGILDVMLLVANGPAVPAPTLSVPPEIAQAIAINRALILMIGGLITAIIVGLFATLRTKPTTATKAQEVLNGTLVALSSSMEARIKTLEAQHKACEERNAQLGQHVSSLENHLRRHGMDIPRAPIVAPVFMLDNQPPLGLSESLIAALAEDTSDA